MKTIFPQMCFLITSLCSVLSYSQTISDFIRIDQFGYLPNSSKVAVIADPQSGYDASQSFKPSLGVNEYVVVDQATSQIVFTGTLTSWNSGTTDQTSGDKAWWFDFSDLTTPGEYYILDKPKNVKSFPFKIATDVYADVLRVAQRMFFYNRCNHEKKSIYAGSNWSDGASFLGPNQDKDARSVTEQNNNATAKDLSGGWWDAGDFNKYVTFTRSVMHNLLDAYEQNPAIWGDNLKIPESGNGIPDLIDELIWELDWLKKMQLADGSSLVKVGCLVNSDGQAELPPSKDNRPRYYYPVPCSSATITQSSVLAHASIVLRQFPALVTYADDLKDRAALAYKFYTNNGKSENCDNGAIQAGDADVTLDLQEQIKIQAAVYLFAATGDATYRTFVDQNYQNVKMIHDTWWGPYESDLGDALMYYTTVSNATANVVSDILTKRISYSQDGDIYKFSDLDPYRAHMKEYHWGSNMIKAIEGNLNFDFIQYNLDAANKESYRTRAEGLLHSFHGVNPFNMVYLTNMAPYGINKSVDEIFHSWYKDGSDWDNAKTSKKGGPAPGYVPGGANQYYADGNGKCLLSPPCNQPPQKSFRAWNGIWPDASWSVTEPAIYYQAAYLKLLSKFASATSNDFPLPGGIVTGVEMGKDPKSFIYPNPTSDSVEITMLGSETTFTIVNAQGQCVDANLAFTRMNDNLKISFAQVPAGIYYLRLNSETSFASQKIVVVK